MARVLWGALNLKETISKIIVSTTRNSMKGHITHHKSNRREEKRLLEQCNKFLGLHYTFNWNNPHSQGECCAFKTERKIPYLDEPRSEI